jgi:hypothetical protein
MVERVTHSYRNRVSRTQNRNLCDQSTAKPCVTTFLYVSAHCIARVLLATIRDQGLCPCPRCLVPKIKLNQVGRVTDRAYWINKPHMYPTNSVKKAREFIYDQGLPISGIAVQRLLKDTSSVPTSVSAFYILSTVEIIPVSVCILECFYGTTWGRFRLVTHVGCRFYAQG